MADGGTIVGAAAWRLVSVRGLFWGAQGGGSCCSWSKGVKEDTVELRGPPGGHPVSASLFGFLLH